MFIPDLKPIDSQLKILKEIPDTFFLRLEGANKLDNSLFPAWLFNKNGNPVIFKKGTVLMERFKAIYDKYKLIQDSDERKKIISAYFNVNSVYKLCANEEGLQYFQLTDLPEDIRLEIDEAFLYLYNSAFKHPPFENFTKDNLKTAIKNFTHDNSLEVCPFCGLEMFIEIDGQGRLALDHWLNKDKFPFASVNFDNLIPIGGTCNSAKVKGQKNVLLDVDQKKRAISFYPYKVNKGINIELQCLELPGILNKKGSWNLVVHPNSPDEKAEFESWKFIFNISERYSSYFDEYLLVNWKKRYVEFIKDDEADINHAKDIEEFKANLIQWKKSFSVRTVPAAMIYRKFIDYLLNNAPDHMLFGIVENFKSQANAGFI